MKQIKLSKQEKQVLRLISSGIVCPNTYPHHIFISCVDSLERLGLVKGLWNEGHELEDVRMTKYGKIYLATNPNLHNPIDWKWNITTIIAIASAIFGAMALFVVCSIKYG